MIFKASYLFCGIGGGALGFQNAREEYKGVIGSFETICGIDVDPAALQDFENITGARGVQMDLFSRQQYIEFHGKEPGPDWIEVTAYDIWRAHEGIAPDVVFTSPPCKGFSGLLPEASAKTKKYQALNQLTLRGIQLYLEAFEDDLPSLFLLENVPRIKSRGASLLNQIKALLIKQGYAVADEDHDCGEIGGLGQRRKRYLLIARNEKKMASFVYKPPLRKLKTIGDVIGPLPMPDDPAAGSMHRLPNLQFKTWLRLALIPAGGDWRDLEKISPKDYYLQHEPRGGGTLGVQKWDEPGHSVIGNARVGGSTAVSISDPRLTLDLMYPSGYGVQSWDGSSQTIRSAGRIMNAPVSIADPRTGFKDGTHGAIYRVMKYDEPANTVTGAHRPNNGALCIADPRVSENGPKFNHAFKISDWETPSGTVAGGTGPSSGGLCISDPRLNGTEGNVQWRNGWKKSGAEGRINQWDKPTDVVMASSKVRGNGAVAVADPRLNQRSQRYPGLFKVQDWDVQSSTIIGQTDIQCGALSIADVRLNCSPRSGTMGVQDWNDTAKTVIASGDIHAGATSVADPRIPADDERGIFYIIALDGTWHRPLTTYELAMLQGFPTHMPNGQPFQLVGKSDASWRERIGNAVPPAAAKAIAESMLLALMASSYGEWTLGYTDIWVMPEREVDELEYSTNSSLSRLQVEHRKLDH